MVGGVMALLLIVVVYLVLGFMYAWITGIVAREEISVGTGVVVLIVSGILSIIAGVALDSLGLDDITSTLADTAINLGCLTLMGKAIAKLEWKHAFIIACVYAVLLFLIFFGLASCAS